MPTFNKCVSLKLRFTYELQDQHKIYMSDSEKIPGLRAVFEEIAYWLD